MGPAPMPSSSGICQSSKARSGLSLTDEWSLRLDEWNAVTEASPHYPRNRSIRRARALYRFSGVRPRSDLAASRSIRNQATRFSELRNVAVRSSDGSTFSSAASSPMSVSLR
jgi:hypothetical protein